MKGIKVPTAHFNLYPSRIHAYFANVFPHIGHFAKDYGCFVKISLKFHPTKD